MLAWILWWWWYERVWECVKEKETIKITENLIKIKYIHYKHFIGHLGIDYVKAHWQLREHGFDFSSFNFSASKKANNAGQKWWLLLKKFKNFYLNSFKHPDYSIFNSCFILAQECIFDLLGLFSLFCIIHICYIFH